MDSDGNIAGAPPLGRLIRFGSFELDTRAGELRKHTIKIHLQEQPLRILIMLLAQPGQPVLREEIQHRLWPNNTMVEFDHGINAAIKRLRAALNDSADEPRYIETLARRGYRFIGIVEQTPSEAPQTPAPPAEASDPSCQTLGPYRLLEKLGEGGMGVVYRAEDLKLGRHVALKLLISPPAEASPEMRERFLHEARAAAALNHPHVCSIFGVEELAGRQVLVMELIEGQTLEHRLAKGPLPVPEALRFATQLARALDAGHRKGIVHRDLKPANIMLSKSGIKVLDFGLAKWQRAAAAAAGVRDGATPGGTILGTPNYMSPEQAQARDTDARSDVFSFGAVVYEMVTGRKAFEEPDLAGVLSAVIEREPTPIASLEPKAPAGLAHLVNACLAKDPEARKQSLHDVALELDWIAEAGASGGKPAPVRQSRRRWIRFTLWGAASVAVVSSAALVLFLTVFAPRKPLVPAPVHFLAYPPEGDTLEPESSVAVSPDGTKFVTPVLDASGTRKLWVHSLASPQDLILDGTEGASLPFWSPDSNSIGFFGYERLKTVSASGGDVREIADAVRPGGGAWNASGTILYCPDYRSALFRVPASGGVPAKVTNMIPGESGHTNPQFLPDGQHFLFFTGNKDATKAGLYLASLDSVDRQRVLNAGPLAKYAPADYLLFNKFGALVAEKFDFKHLRPLGEPSPLAGPVRAMSVSANGVLAYVAQDAPVQRRVVWHGRDGRMLGFAGEPGLYDEVSLSPNEKFAAVNVGIPGQGVNIFLLQFDTNVLSRVTSAREDDWDGVWSPDSRRLLYQIFQFGKTTLMVYTLGEPTSKLVYDDGTFNFPDAWSPDGKWILCRGMGGMVAYLLPASGDGKRQVLLESKGAMDSFQFSPDGKWLAYNSMESGQQEVYIASFPSMTGIRQVSRGGCQPIWRKDGKELFYLTEEGDVMAVELTAGSTLQAGSPKTLFHSRTPVNCTVSEYDVGSNGQKFLMVESETENTNTKSVKTPIDVIVPWEQAIR